MTHRSRRKELPLSMENVRKKILRVVQKVEMESKGFLQKFSGSLDAQKSWSRGMQKTCAQVGMSPADLHNLDDLESVLQKVRVNQELSVGEYNELRRLVERARAFDYIAYELPGGLVDVYVNQMEKFCLSFCQEAPSQDLQSVTDYELVITECRQQIASSLSRVEEDLDDVEDRRRVSVVKYVEDYEMVLEKMESICRGIGDVCQEMRRWMAADAEYVRDIQEEINSDNRRLIDLKTVVKEMEEGRDNDGKRMRNAAVGLEKVEKRLRDVREEIGHYKARRRNVEENRNNLEEDMTRKQDEHGAVQERLRNRVTNSPSLNIQLSTHSEALRMEIRGMENRLQQMDAQVETLRSEEQRARVEMERMSAEVETSRKRHDGALERTEKHEDMLETSRKEVEKTEEKILALKKIRDVKLNSDSLKRIHNHGYNPEPVFENKDELQEAFRVTSEDIGKDWVNLYQRLPFDPPRDYSQRKRDLEVIDISHRRLDVGFKLLALKSLEKWRRLSRMASVEELMATLRKMRMDNTAGKIRHATTPRNTARTH